MVEIKGKLNARFSQTELLRSVCLAYLAGVCTPVEAGNHTANRRPMWKGCILTTKPESFLSQKHHWE